MSNDQNKPKSSERKTLSELIAGITPENKHPEVDFGPPVGREILDPWPDQLSEDNSD